MSRVTGQTRGAGFQIGVQRTVARPLEETWRFLTSPRGLALWLGPGAQLGRAKHAPYRTDDDSTGELRSLRELDRIRLTWRPAGWTHDTTVQVALTERDGRTAIRFHQERLADVGEREAMRRRWKRVAEVVARELEAAE